MRTGSSRSRSRSRGPTLADGTELLPYPGGPALGAGDAPAQPAAGGTQDCAQLPEQRERCSALQQHIAAVVGHDLRNPLNAIISSVELLEALPPPLTPGQRHHLERIGVSARRMEGLIRDLLDYARLQAGRGIPLVRRDVDVRELCGQIVEELGVANASRTIVLEPGGEGRGSCDPDRIMQLLGNLVSNALKHGTRDRPVRVRCRCCTGGFVLEVENEGPAIPEAVLHRAFEPFVQGAGADRSGVGLGLFIAQEIARAHGGGVEGRSTGEATVFTVRIPRPT